MNNADEKGFDARISDLEDRMDNVVEGALLLTEVVENLHTMVRAALDRTESLRTAHLALTDAVKIVGEEHFDLVGKIKKGIKDGLG